MNCPYYGRLQYLQAQPPSPVDYTHYNSLQAMRILCFLGFCSALSPGLLGQRPAKKGLTLVHQWSTLDYEYESPEARQHAIDDGSFVPGNGIPIDVDVHYNANSKSRVFVTVPKFQVGIPATLTTVGKRTSGGNPVLRPYPSWQWHRDTQLCGEHRLVSVFRVKSDECGRLWVLDSGKVGDRQLCRAQILAFDLATDRLLHRYEIPAEQLKAASILVTPAVDVRDAGRGCRDTFVYAADVTGFGLIVHDVRRARSWRVANKLFYPVPEYGTFTIAGESFDLMDGVLGLALSPLVPGQERTLYFHALASATENHVSTAVLRNESLFAAGEDAVPRQFRVYPKRRPSQSAAEAMDSNGVLYFGLTRETAIDCWNSRTDYDQRNFDTLETNVDTLQFPSGVKVVTNRLGGEELWVLTCRFQKVMTGSMDQTNDINFRIQAVKLEDFVRGSKCARAHAGGASSGGGYGLWPRSGAPTAEQQDAASTQEPAPAKRQATAPDDDAIVFTGQ